MAWCSVKYKDNFTFIYQGQIRLKLKQLISLNYVTFCQINK